MKGKRTDLADAVTRFWEKVDIKDTNSCWEWKIGCNTRQGYPLYKSGRAYRISWEYTYGKIPKTINGKNIVIRHLCGNKLCCNPNHLRIGTVSENNSDRFRLDGAKALSKEDVLNVRKLSSIGIPYSHISTLYHVSPPTIKHAVVGKGTYGEV